MRPCSRRRGLATVFALSASILLPSGCRTAWEARFATPRHYTDLDLKAPFLKAHLRDGSVAVLKGWEINEAKETIVGDGLLYDARRRLRRRGMQRLSFANIKLVETNRPKRLRHNAFVVLGVLSGVSLAASIACIANPKACFGSCPTFYASDGQRMLLQAEGFSDSAAPSLEAKDIDALYFSRPTTREFSLLMKNEALETHVVRGVRLLAVPRPAGARRIFRSGERFYPAYTITSPARCRSHLGDCRAKLAAMDLDEYRSPTDESNLAKPELVELAFNRPTSPMGQRLGLVIGARNSLVNTFLFYQTLAYMGSLAGDWLMMLERSTAAGKAMKRLGALLAKISVEVSVDGGPWIRVGEIAEAGPIAREVHLLRLPASPARKGETLRVRLRMAQGYWKVDWAALVTLGEAVRPIPVPIARVQHEGAADAPGALARLRDPKAHLMTYPGDAYRLHFRLPRKPAGFELFVESEGYYIEWMRRRWLEEEDPDKVLEIFADPEAALKRLAPIYKRKEASVEMIFWRSRVSSGALR